MVTIVTRAGKGTPLTNTEVDTNFTNLNSGKVETSAIGTIAAQDADDVAITGGSISGITDLAVADGGTGLSSLTANNVILGNGASAVQFVAPGANGNILASDGTTWASSAAPVPAALSTASGSAPSYSARAWVNFNGTGVVAIRASGNVSSITDNGIGNYTVNIDVDMPNINYAVIVGIDQSNAITTKVQNGTQVFTFAVGSFRILTGTINETATALTDFNGVFASVFR